MRIGFVQSFFITDCLLAILLFLTPQNHAFSPRNLLPQKTATPSLAMTATQTTFAPFYIDQPPPTDVSFTSENCPSPHEEWMKIAPPSDDLAVDLLHRLDAVLKRPGVQFHFDQLILLENNSVRRINAGRYEVFIEDCGKDSTAFDWIASKIASDPTFTIRLDKEAVKQRILDYARQQAIASGYPNYIFHNFSILISYDWAPQQYPHIDLQRPNAQFGLVITDQSPGTVWFEPSHQIQSPCDLAQAWQSSSTGKWVSAMEHSPKCRSLLKRFGDVLSPNFQRHEPNGGNPLPTGTLLSLPGGVVHAGPASSKSRAVLFFSGHPCDTPIRPYNPDVQYFASILLSDVIAAVWEELEILDREYLLNHLVSYLQRAEHKNMHKHLPGYCSMHQFAKRIEKEEIMTEKGIDQYIRDFARQEKLLL